MYSRSGDHQLIIARDGTVGSYENVDGAKKRRGFVPGKWSINSLSPGWHRLTISSACADGACKTHKTTYYVDGKAYGSNDYTSESDFYAVGNYQVS